MFCSKGVLRNFTKFTGKHLCQRLFFNKVADGACNFIKKETLAQVFSCEFYKTSKNSFFCRTPLVAAFGSSGLQMFFKISVLENFAKFSGIRTSVLVIF